jgi:broad specificity phosphatase PhoE
VRNSKADALWQRFKAASDAFFQRYKEKDEIAAQANAALREELLVELEALASATAEQAETAAKIRELLERWRQAPPPPASKAAAFEQRFLALRDRLIEAQPGAFKGGELDPEANRAKRAKLVARVEALLQAQGGPPGGEGGASLAERLKEALATNAMGGRAALEARWRETARELEQAQAAWKRIGPVPGEEGRELQLRFQKACDALASKRPR